MIRFFFSYPGLRPFSCPAPKNNELTAAFSQSLLANKAPILGP